MKSRAAGHVAHTGEVTQAYVHKFRQEKVKGRDHLGDQNIDGIILK
jgi:hypothetical protein